RSNFRTAALPVPLVPKLCLGTHSLETPFRVWHAKQSLADMRSQTEFGNENETEFGNENETEFGNENETEFGNENEGETMTTLAQTEIQNPKSKIQNLKSTPKAVTWIG